MFSMALVPYYANGRIRLANMPINAAGDRDRSSVAEEESRRLVVQKCRLYYEGQQYDWENDQKAKTLNLDAMNGRLPEHERLNAYSTQIAESVDFIADQVSDGFRVVAEDPAVQEVLDGAFGATDVLTAGDADEDLSVDEILTDALVSSDVPYEVRWDPIDGTCFLELWESEQVHFVNPVGSQVSHSVALCS